MKFYDAIEAEQLKQLIANKEAYLQKVNNKFAYQQLQKEILLLKNEILPIILRNTNIVHSEVAKAATMAFEVGLQFKVNGLLIYIPIDENYTDNPIMGIYNTRSLLQVGTPGAVEINCEIINMDGNDAVFHPLHLPLNILMHGTK